MADNGGTCDAACTALGKSCNAAKMSTLTSAELAEPAYLEAGYTCPSITDCRTYAGAPFRRSTSGSCTWICEGGTAVCDDNNSSNHSPLCYCE